MASSSGRWNSRKTASNEPIARALLVTSRKHQLEELYKGITIEGMRYGPITANLERRTGRNQWIEMTLTEGKNREVRKVLEYFGFKTRG